MNKHDEDLIAEMQDLACKNAGTGIATCLSKAVDRLTVLVKEKVEFRKRSLRIWPGFVILLFVSLLCSQAGATCTTGALPFNLQNNTVADATQVMANFNQIVNGTAVNCASSGANTDITSLGGLTTPLSAGQGGTAIWTGGTSTGSANAQVVASVTPSTGFSLTQNKCVLFTAGFTNTAAAQLNVFSTGLTNVFRQSPSGPQALTGGEIIAANQVFACYDGTEYQLFDPPGQDGGLGLKTNLASAGTTDLGTVPSHNVNVTGVTTITAFGSSASVTYPYYVVTFAGALTLTYNASSLILPGTANIVTAANDTALLQYLGSGNWQVMAYSKANGTAVVNPTPLCGFTGLVIFPDGGTPNTSLDVFYDSSVLINPTGNVPIFVGIKSFVIDTTNGTVTSTANGMDGEARGNNNWVTVWGISNGTTWAGLGSLNAPPTGPTLPAGYSYYCYAGALKTNGSGNFYYSVQRGRDAQFVQGANNVAVLPLITNGVQGTSCDTTTPTWLLATIRGTTGVGIWTPSTSVSVNLLLTNAYNGNGPHYTAVAPNGSYVGAGAASTTAAAPLSLPAGAGFVASASASLIFESFSVAFCGSGTGSALWALGWRDNVNAQ